MEVTLAVSAQNQGSSAADESLLSDVRAENVSLSALATSGVEYSVTDVLVDSERFTSNSRLVTSNDSRSLVDTFVIVIVSAMLFTRSLGAAERTLITASSALTWFSR